MIGIVIMFLLAFRSHAFLPHATRGLMRRSFSELASVPGALYLQVPFQDKDAVKSLGAKFDFNVKKWYVPPDVDSKPFLKWQKIYLNVPYAQKDKVKELGATWDAAEGKWFVTGGQDLKRFVTWIKAEEKRIKEAAGSKQGDAAAISSPNKYSKTSADMKINPNDTVLLIDVDTNGLPYDVRNTCPIYSNLKNYDSARIVMLSYQLCNKTTLNTLENQSFLIESEGFPIDNTEFHGITLADSLKQGVHFTQAINTLKKHLSQTSCIVAHNIDFALNVLKSELFRHGLLDELAMVESKKAICIMTSTMNLFQLKDKIGNPKKISLKELVKFTVDEELPRVHNASTDVDLLRRALQKLVANKEYTL